jgi:hypothetical protein
MKARSWPGMAAAYQPRTGAGAAGIASLASVRTSTRLAGLELEQVGRDGPGGPVALGSLWRERPVVLVFIRHFG